MRHGYIKTHGTNGDYATVGSQSVRTDVSHRNAKEAGADTYCSCKHQTNHSFQTCGVMTAHENVQSLQYGSSLTRPEQNRNEFRHPNNIPPSRVTGVPFVGVGDHQNDCAFFGILGLTPWFDHNNQYERMIPDDGRSRVVSTMYPNNLMVRFVDPSMNPSVIVGTGALIGPRHILTAAHVVYDCLKQPSPYNTHLKIQAWGQGGDFTMTNNVYVPSNYAALCPWTGIMTTGGFSIDVDKYTLFASNDYALVIADSDILPPNSTFFNYDYASGPPWWKGKMLSTLGFPSNSGPPVRDTESVAWQETWCGVKNPTTKWLGVPFGYATGELYGQTVNASSIVYSKSLQVYFDMGRGQSGSPVFIDTGNNIKTIYGILSVRGRAPLKNYAHNFNSQSIADIDKWMADWPF